MKYELAKKLKDAGFPQPNPLEEGGRFVYGPTIDGGATGLSTSDMAPFYCPTLEELIEACGYNFVSLGQDLIKSSTWRCGDYIGSTPSEAVANLWLALHTK